MATNGSGRTGADLEHYLDIDAVHHDGFTPEELDLLADFVSDDEDFDPSADPPRPDYSCVIIVDNLPKVGEARYPKLCGYITSVYSKLGDIVEDGLYMPLNEETKTTEAFAFIEFDTPEQASAAVTTTNNWNLDKRHTLRVRHYRDLHTYTELPETFEEPEAKGYDTGEDLYSWLFDTACRDQFALRYDMETEVHWAETKQRPMLEYAGDREKALGKVWVEDKVQWSPMGTYLCTFHKRGVALWGGANFRKMRRFPHMGVHAVVMSGDERFITTWNGIPMMEREMNFPEAAAIVWDVRTGHRLREFSQVQRSPMPDFAWTQSGKFMVRLAHVFKQGSDTPTTFIRAYEAPSMALVGSSSIKAEGAMDMQVSPTDDIIAYWSPERANTPACVSLVELPSKRKVRSKNLFNVKNCRLIWQNSGDFLCVQVTRTSKTGKTEFTNLELFRMREKAIPIEMLKITDPVIYFAWEPTRTRFGLIHGRGPMKFEVSFYDMGPAGSQLQLLYTLPEQGVNEMFWSPLGNHVVLAGMQNLNGERLEFFDVDENKSLAIQEHYLCTNIVWDPSGRIVASMVAQSLYGDSPMRFTMQNGYNLWTFQGAPIHEEGKQKLFHFLWRPRPPSLLSKEERQSVKSNLKKSIARYQAADRRKANRAKYKKFLARHEERLRFSAWMADARAHFDARRADRVSLRGYESENEDDDIKIYQYEVVMGKKVEEVEKFV